MSRRAESTYHPGRLFAPEFHDPDFVHHAVLKDIFPLPERAPLPFPARTMAGYEVFSARLRRYVDKHHQPRNCCAHCFRCHWRRLRVQRTPYVMPKPLPRCSGCNITYYCDRVCQEEDWSRHKNYCKDIQACRDLEASWDGRRLQEYHEVLLVGQNGTRLYTPFACRGWRKMGGTT